MEEMLDGEGSNFEDNTNDDPDLAGINMEHEEEAFEQEPEGEKANHEEASGQEGESSAYPSEQENDAEEEAADVVAEIGSDRFEDRPTASPDRPNSVPHLKLTSKKKKKTTSSEKEDSGSDTLPFESSSSESESESFDRDEFQNWKSRTRIGTENRYPTRNMHRSSDEESLTDGLEKQRQQEGLPARFDGRSEYKSLVNEVQAYGETHRGMDGKIHRNEDLPVRMAFEHLNSLSGMTNKVQDAIDLSRNVFERKVVKMERGILFKAWRGWLLVNAGQSAKRNILQRALSKMRRRKLWAAFSKWSEITKKAKRGSTMYRAICTVIRNGRKRRAFHAWAEEAADGRRRLRMVAHSQRMREEYFELLVKAGLRQVIHKRVRSAWSALHQFSGKRRAKRNKMRQVIRRATHGRESRALQKWIHWNFENKQRRAKIRHIIIHMRKSKMARAFKKWRAVYLAKKRVLTKLVQGTLTRAWAKWWSNIVLLRKAALIFCRWKHRNLFSVLNCWASIVETRVLQRNQCELICLRVGNRIKRRAWKQWIWCVEEATGCTMEHVKELQKENARLRRDNERFVRLVDSGEWGRGRVEELTEAGRVLRAERRQLEVLMEKITLEKEETAGLKNRMLSGNFVQRNKLNIAGGSTFNALQRVMKQDVLDSGAVGRYPDQLKAMFEVPRMSLDTVTVFPDGYLNIQADNSSSRMEPFAKGDTYSESMTDQEQPQPEQASVNLAQRRNSRDKVLIDALSSLSADEVDALEDILRRRRS